jgi:glycosyltransferase involved in cell wall biosynthesis
MSRDLVVFAEDWGRHPASTEHLVRRLAKTRKVLWMNSIGMRRPKFSLTDAKRAWAKVGQLMAPPASSRIDDIHQQSYTPPSLRVVAPHAIPAPGNPLASALNRWLLSRQVHGRMQSYGMSKPVLWLTLPSAWPVVGTLDEYAVVYYCADDFGSLAGVDHGPILEMEKKLATRADLIIVVSDQLAKKFPSDKTIVVPHGVDFDIFTTPVPRADDLPVGRKIAGFYGSLPHWVDPQLITRTAAEMPDWLFVFVGGGTLFADGAAPANTLFLGSRAHAELPRYVQHWDVSILPYRDCEPLRAGNPLKLREYLAAGTPIASVDFPALAPYRDIVSLAADPAYFADAIRAAAGDGARNGIRRKAVASNTWEARAADVDAALEAL